MASAELLRSAPPAPRHPLTRARIETLTSRAIIGFGLVFGVLVIPTLLAQQPRLVQPLGWLQAGLLCAALLWAVASAVALRGMRVAASAVALLYLVMLALWPLTVAGHEEAVDGTPWLWMLCTVAAAYATVGMSPWLAASYALVAPALFGVVLWLVTGGHEPGTPILDALYSAVVGETILSITTLLHHAAGRVDAAQRAALDEYEQGVRAHANEAERVEVDALVHDSVLTTLLAAANARTPEAKELAARMADDALGHLSVSSPASAAVQLTATDAAGIAAGLRDAARLLAHPPLVRTAGDPAVTVPVEVAEALHAATLQAMVNSSQHAGGSQVTRTVTVSAAPAVAGAASGPRIGVEIADDGAGFELSAVAPRRLGLATSIVQRVEVVGGRAVVVTAPGAGTVITLEWPA